MSVRQEPRSSTGFRQGEVYLAALMHGHSFVMLFVYMAKQLLDYLLFVFMSVNLFQQDIHTLDCISFPTDTGFKKRQSLQGIHLISRWICSLSVGQHQEQLRNSQKGEQTSKHHAHKTGLASCNPRREHCVFP